MKQIKLLLALLIISIATYAQNRIDDKYKNPSPGSKTSTFVQLDFNKDLLIKQYGKSQSDKIFDKCQAEYNSFNQNGDEVWIYANEFFNGEKKILKVGDYTLVASAKSKELGTNWNDRISSMLIPAGLTVEVFMDDKFAGLKAIVVGYGFKNRETDEKGFKGDYYTFKDLGKYSKGGIYFVANQAGSPMILANDNISSLKIYK